MIMNPRRSLFIKVLLWFLMSLVLLIALVAGIFITWISVCGQIQR